jgi:hypothetical protein
MIHAAILATLSAAQAPEVRYNRLDDTTTVLLFMKPPAFRYDLWVAGMEVT